MSILIHYIIAFSITSLTLFGLGLFVYLRDRKKKVNQTFAFWIICAAIWSGGSAFCVNGPNEMAALIWARIFHIGVIYIKHGRSFNIFHTVSCFVLVRR